jgi:hypothetical protein
MPARLEASGLGDIDGHLLWRWRRETASRPELYSFVKVAFPATGGGPPHRHAGLGSGSGYGPRPWLWLRHRERARRPRVRGRLDERVRSR